MRKPTAVQKLLHRFFMLQPVTAFFSTRAQGIDRAVLGLTKGRYAATEILGWHIIQLTTLGAKTGQPRTGISPSWCWSRKPKSRIPQGGIHLDSQCAGREHSVGVVFRPHTSGADDRQTQL